MNTQFYGEIFLAISDHIAFAIKRKKEKIDFILAVGGGSVIDCCKVISSQAVIDEDIWKLEYVHGKFPTEGIPMGAIVTASGTGAERKPGKRRKPQHRSELKRNQNYVGKQSVSGDRNCRKG